MTISGRHLAGLPETHLSFLRVLAEAAAQGAFFLPILNIAHALRKATNTAEQELAAKNDIFGIVCEIRAALTKVGLPRELIESGPRGAGSYRLSVPPMNVMLESGSSFDTR